MSPTTMKAARFHPDTGSVSVDTVPIPRIDDNEILVKMRSASLCHSDLMLLDGSAPEVNKDPVTMGHEGAGYVDACGKNVRGFKKGDKIGFLYIKGCCFTCKGCLLQNLNCETGKGKLQGFDTDGMLAEYAAIDYRNAVQLPDAISIDTASTFFCAGFTAFHAVDNCECAPGDWLAIIGCGGLGLFGVKYAKAMGFMAVAMDIKDDVLQLAKKAGADMTINTRTEAESVWLPRLLEETGGGVRATPVFSAVQAAYDTAAKILGLEGVLMVVGLPGRNISFDAVDLTRKKYRVKAENTGPPQKLARAVNFTSEHGIQPAAEFFGIEQINEMIDKMKTGNVTERMVVLFG